MVALRLNVEKMSTAKRIDREPKWGVIWHEARRNMVFEFIVVSALWSEHVSGAPVIAPGISTDVPIEYKVVMLY